MERLTGAGLVGLAVLGMGLLLPLSVVSFYLTAHLTVLALMLAVIGAMVLWVVLLPPSMLSPHPACRSGATIPTPRPATPSSSRSRCAQACTRTAGRASRPQHRLAHDVAQVRGAVLATLDEALLGSGLGRRPSSIVAELA